jgi:hypothetical protein
LIFLASAVSEESDELVLISPESELDFCSEAALFKRLGEDLSSVPKTESKSSGEFTLLLSTGGAEEEER